MTHVFPVGALLIGGQSRRFGSPKPLITIHGETLLDRGRRILTQALGAPPLIIGNAPAAAVVTTTPDLRDNVGPLGGIETALTAADGRPVFVMAADLAGMTAEFIRWIAVHPSTADLVAPSRAGRLQPLCARWSANSLSVVTARLDANKRAVMGAVDRLTVHDVTEPLRQSAGFTSPTLLNNINSIDDLNEFQRDAV